MSNINEKWKVYKLVSPTGRTYVGCTKLPANRRWKNGMGYKNNTELFNDILSYGWNNFECYIIAEYEDETAAREREHSEIQKFPDGYNTYRGVKGYVPTGNPPSSPKKVLCVETNRTYSSVHMAASETGLSRVKISECCNGKRKRTGGCHWKFV